MLFPKIGWNSKSAALGGVKPLSAFASNTDKIKLLKNLEYVSYRVFRGFGKGK